jgi:hypothetical protein
MPDLITEAVVVEGKDEEEEDQVSDLGKGNNSKSNFIESHKPVFSSKNMKFDTKSYAFNDKDEGLMIASSQLNENLIRSME